MIFSNTKTSYSRWMGLALMGMLSIESSNLVIFSGSARAAQVSNNSSSDENSLIEDGLKLYQESKHQESLIKFEQALVIVKAKNDKKTEGVVLYSIGLTYDSLKEYPKALAYYQQSLAISKLLGDRASEGIVLDNIGLVYNSLGEYPKALAYCQQSLAISKALGDKNSESITLNNIGEIYRAIAQYPKALEYYQQSLSIIKTLEDRAGEARTLNNIGATYKALGQYPKALQYYQQSLVLSRAIGNKNGEGITLNNIGAAHSSLGEYSQALKYFQQSLDISKIIGNKTLENANIDNIGQIYYSTAQYPKAIEYFQQYLAISQSIGAKASEGKALNNLGGVYSSLGQYPKALEYYQKSLALSQVTGAKASEGIALNNIGTVYNYLNRYAKALEYFQKSLAINKAIGDRESEGLALNNIGGVYSSLEQYPKALEYYQQSLTIRRAIGDKAGEGITLNNIGEFYRYSGQFPKALVYFQQALAISQAIGSRDSEGTALSNMGATFLNQKKPAAAEISLRKAIAIWEDIRGSKNTRGQGLSDLNKVSFADRVAITYQLLQKSLIEQNKPQAALEISERARARALAELLASKIITSKASSQSIRQFPSFAKIQQIAKAKQATLVQYSIIDDDLVYIWVIKPNGEIAFKQSKLPATTKLKDLIVGTRLNIGADTPTPAQKNLPKPPGDLQQLYKLLIEPIAKVLPTNPESKVIILPQKELFLVPFAALQDVQKKYLIEQHTLTIAPSIQVLGLTNANRARNSGKPVVVGNPTMPTDYKNQAGELEVLENLPGSEAEATSVAQILQVTPLIGQAADKKRVVELLQNASIVHLATHGLLGTLKGDIPGAIVLTNGFLTSSEIFDMQLHADLVVLSACDTGRGDLTGDGVVGLSRSLAVAGVPAAIVSLWPVSDVSTKELMEDFYGNLWVKKMSKSQAIRQAMLKTMQKYPAPDLWAAFMLVGDGND